MLSGGVCLILLFLWLLFRNNMSFLLKEVSLLLQKCSCNFGLKLGEQNPSEF